VESRFSFCGDERIARLHRARKIIDADVLGHQAAGETVAAQDFLQPGLTAGDLTGRYVPFARRLAADSVSAAVSTVCRPAHGTGTSPFKRNPAVLFAFLPH